MLIHAYILSGGRSSRMGGDPKGLKTLGGIPMVQHVIDICQPKVEKLTIIGDPLLYGHLGYEVIIDDADLTQCGPISGIYTAAKHSNASYCLVLGCDTPCIPIDLIEALIAQCDGHDVVIPIHGEKLEPLCALYNPAIKDGILQCARSGILKVSDVITQFEVLYLDVDYILERWPKAFFNVNTPQDFVEAELLLT